LLVGCSRDDGWVNFHPTNEYFTVAFPSEPSRKSMPLQPTTPKIEGSFYAVTTPENTTYSVMVGTYPKEILHYYTPDQILDLGVERTLKQRQSARTIKSTTTIQGYPARVVFSSDPDPAVHSSEIIKSCMAGPRIYVIQTVKLGSFNDQKQIDHFFDSFKLE